MLRKMGLCILVWIICVGTPLYAADLKIAVVDMNKIMNSSKEGTSAKVAMKKRYEELKGRIDKRQDELKKMKEDIEKQKIILGKEKMQEKQKEFEKKMVEFRKLVSESEREMRETESAHTNKILKKIREVVVKEVKAKGYSLVLDMTGSVVYADESLDVSGSVLDTLNKEFKGEKN